MQFQIIRTNKFKKSYKKLIKQNIPKRYIEDFNKVISILGSGNIPDPETNGSHKIGEVLGYKDCWDIHIGGPQSDVVLIVFLNKKEKTVYLINIGSHSHLEKILHNSVDVTGSIIS